MTIWRLREPGSRMTQGVGGLAEILRFAQDDNLETQDEQDGRVSNMSSVTT